MIRRLLLLDHPQETRFFLFLGVFGVILAVVYWVLSYELAGSTLLLGFGVGTGVLGFVLLRSRPRRMAIAARQQAAKEGSGTERLPDGDDMDLPGGQPGGIDTPFDDPSGRIPDESLAPLALGLGVALAATAVIFGPWLLIAGMLPLMWGGWTWLAGARDELDATVEDEGAGPTPRDAADSAAGPTHARPAHREP